MATENPINESIINKGYIIYQEPIHLKTSSYMKNTNKAQNHFGTPLFSLACLK